MKKKKVNKKYLVNDHEQLSNLNQTSQYNGD